MGNNNLKLRIFRQRIIAVLTSAIILVFGGRYFEKSSSEVESDPEAKAAIEITVENDTNKLTIEDVEISVTEEFDINSLRNIPDELKPYIVNYENKVSEFDPDLDFTNFHNNLKTMKFIDCSIEGENYDINQTIEYDPEINTLYYNSSIPTDKYIYHELNHLNFDSYNSTSGAFTKSNMYGISICEGNNAAFEESVFGAGTYDVSKHFVRLETYLFDPNLIYQIYKSGDIYALETLLATLDRSKENAQEYIKSRDALHRLLFNWNLDYYDENVLSNVQKSLVDYFFLSLNTKELSEVDFIRNSAEFSSLLVTNISYILPVEDYSSGMYFESRLEEYIDSKYTPGSKENTRTKELYAIYKSNLDVQEVTERPIFRNISSVNIYSVINSYQEKGNSYE